MLKNLLIASSLLFISHLSFSQDNLGLVTGNYAGITGISLQPANVVDNRFKFDLNIISASVNFDNNYLGFSRNYFLNNRFSFKDFNNYNDFKTKILVENDLKGKKAYFNLNNRLQSPVSFLLTTGKQSGIALNIQSRTAIAIKDLNPDFAKQVYDFWKFPATHGRNFNMDNMQINAMNWLEVGLTYGKVILDKDKHFLKFGVTAKYLGGISSLNLKANNLTVRAENDSVFSGFGNVDYNHSESNLSTNINSSYRPDATSWGGDIGFVYEFRARINKFLVPKYNKKDDYTEEAKRRDKNKYSAKLGVSLLDVGVLNYKSAPLARNFNMNVSNFNLNTFDVRNVKQFDTVISKNVTYTGAAGEQYSVAMPTALSAQLDLHILKGFYVNAMAYKPFNSLNKKATYRIQSPDYYAVTPRWESRVAGVYVPFSINSDKVISAGATVRLGPIFIGTSNMLTLLKKDNIQAADLHAGLKVPIAFGKPSKTANWFKKFTTIDEKTIENEEVELKEINKKAAPQQPIQIIINNYNYPGAEQGSNGSEGKSYKVNTGENNQEIIIQENKIDVKELNELQQQIDYLRNKLNQKEQLINEIEKSNTNGNQSSESKKKIDSLTFVYQFDTVFVPAKKIESSNYSLLQKKEKTIELLAELDALEKKEKSLNQKIDAKVDVINTQINDAQKSNDAQKIQALTTQKATWVKVDTMQGAKNALVDFPLKNEQYTKPLVAGNKKINTLSSPFPSFSQETNNIEKSIATKPTTVQPITTNLYKSNTTPIASNPIQSGTTYTSPAIDVNNVLTKKEAELLMSKKDAALLMTKNDYQNLLLEIAKLKEEVKISRMASQKSTTPIINNLPVITNKTNTNTTKVIIDTTYKSLAQANNNKEIQIIRDTIYIEKPIETIVERIVRDTVVNTIEKNNIITKVEEKTVFTNNERELILKAEPEVILFDVGSFMIKSVYFPKLISLSNKYKKYPELKVSIQGHTDNTGSIEKNKILSENRANAVKVYLMNHGVNKNSFMIDSYGSENPLVENKTKQGKSQNRRVDVKIVE